MAFGTVRIYARELIDDESINCELEPVIRNPDYKHPAKLRDLPTKLAAECAVDRAQDLIDQIQEDELEENGHFAKETARLSREESETQPRALSVNGSGEWALDSGSSFYILSKHDMEKSDKRKAYTLADPVCMHTADGEVSTNQGIMKKPFGDILDLECLILPNSPSLLSLGGLCMESGLIFIGRVVRNHG